MRPSDVPDNYEICEILNRVMKDVGTDVAWDVIRESDSIPNELMLDYLQETPYKFWVCQVTPHGIVRYILKFSSKAIETKHKTVGLYRTFYEEFCEPGSI